MHVWTFRISFKKAAILSAAAAVILFCGICAAVLRSAEETVREENTSDFRIAYLELLGIEVDPAGAEARTVVIPPQFDEVYKKYAALQSDGGKRLRAHAGLAAELWSYPVTNAPNYRDDIRANLLTYEGIVIGFDLSALSESSNYSDLEEIPEKSGKS